MFFYIFLSLLISLELICQLVVRFIAIPNGLIALKKLPKITPSLLKKFVEHGFDPDLGWTRKANTQKIDSGIPYKINSLGSRENSSLEKSPIKIATFGDSYVFCREVADDETWQNVLGQNLNCGVLNYGVGNYGLDQAYIRLKKELPQLLQKEIKIEHVIIGFVPHTLARCLSYWKHYNEFGNILGFKPRFKLNTQGQLQCLECLIKKPEDYLNYEKILAQINQDDSFYKNKFLKESFTFPFLFSFAKNPKKIVILGLKLLKILSWKSVFNKKIDDLIVLNDLNNGAMQLRTLYQNIQHVKLLEKICLEIHHFCSQLGINVSFVVMPMKDDLIVNRYFGHFYNNFVKRLNGKVDIIDLMENFNGQNDSSIFFKKWHYSAQGNNIVAKILQERIKWKTILTQKEHGAKIESSTSI